MCMAIYAALFGLFIYYSHTVVEQYILATSSGDELIVVAVGWELAPLLWPLLVAAMLLASAVTVWVMRRMRGSACCEQDAAP